MDVRIVADEWCTYTKTKGKERQITTDEPKMPGPCQGVGVALQRGRTRGFCITVT